MLIEDGADVNALNNDKNSALILAADNGNVKYQFYYTIVEAY